MESLLTAERSAWMRPGSLEAGARVAEGAADIAAVEVAAAGDTSVAVAAEVAVDTEAVVTVDMVEAVTAVTVVVAATVATTGVVAEDTPAAAEAGGTPRGEAEATAVTGTSLAAMVTGLGARTETAMTATPCSTK